MSLEASGWIPPSHLGLKWQNQAKKDDSSGSNEAKHQGTENAPLSITLMNGICAVMYPRNDTFAKITPFTSARKNMKNELFSEKKIHSTPDGRQGQKIPDDRTQNGLGSDSPRLGDRTQNGSGSDSHESDDQGIVLTSAQIKTHEKMMRLSNTYALRRERLRIQSEAEARQKKMWQEQDALGNSARSKSTEAQYMSRVRGLFMRSTDLRSSDPQVPVNPTPLEVVDDLLASTEDQSTKPKWLQQPYRGVASFILYRAALLWFMHSRIEGSPEYEIAYQKLVKAKHPLSTGTSTGTGTEKTKRVKRAKVVFKGDDLFKIFDALRSLDEGRKQWGMATTYWLKAGIACGARTSEWEGVSWLDRSNHKLLIPNSKQKLARPACQRMLSNPEAQTVYEIESNDDDFLRGNKSDSEHDLEHDFEDDSEDDSEQDTEDDYDETKGARGKESHRVVIVKPADAVNIDRQLIFLEAAIGHKVTQGMSRHMAFKQYLASIRRALRKACFIAFKGKRYYRLYDTRSQFAANKKVDHPLGSVASMMGHSNTKTTKSSYGSRAAGLKARRAQTTQGQVPQQDQAPQHVESDVFAPDTDGSEGAHGESSAADVPRASLS